VQAGQFVLYSPQLSFGATPATDLGMTDEYLIGGALFYQYGFQLSGAGITNLSQLPR
jgi:hypothetical protein